MSRAGSKGDYSSLSGDPIPSGGSSWFSRLTASLTTSNQKPVAVIKKPTSSIAPDEKLDVKKGKDTASTDKTPPPVADFDNPNRWTQDPKIKESSWLRSVRGKPSVPDGFSKALGQTLTFPSSQSLQGSAPRQAPR